MLQVGVEAIDQYLAHLTAIAVPLVGRYDLSKQISAIDYEPLIGAELFDVEAIGLDGNAVFSEDEISLSRIEELAGKDTAKKDSDPRRQGEK